MESDSVRVLVAGMGQELAVYNDILSIIGVCYLGKIFLSVLYNITRLCVRYLHYQLNESRNLRDLYGEWAVVTGASDGIGRAYAFELARRGMNIVLISRTLTKLQLVAEEIGKLYGVKTQIIVIDFNKGYEAFEGLNRLFQELDIGVLVNNVGVLLKRPMKFEKMSEDCIREHINVNIIPCSMLTKMVLPHMMRRKRGAIINLSSVAALQPTPLFALYSATKVYADFFSQALQYECKKKNIVVQTLLPWFVNTKMIDYSKDLKRSWLVPNAAKYARHAVKTLGVTERTSGYWLHDVIAAITSSMPPSIYKYASVKVLKFLSRLPVK